jgi:hypothetical protein
MKRLCQNFDILKDDYKTQNEDIAFFLAFPVLPGGGLEGA